MKTKIIFNIACLLLLSFLFSSCGPLIFKANFDADTVGNAPNPNPPGDPSDDKIQGNCGISVVNSGVVNSNAMRFYNDPNCAVALMWFQSGNLPASNQFLNYTFTGYPESTSHRDFTLSVAGGHFSAAFTITYKGGTMYLTDANYTDRNIGTYSANQKQTFLVSLKRETNTYSVTIARTGTSNIQLSNRPIKEANFWGQPAYILYAFYDTNDANSSANGFVFDTVTMNKEKLD